MLYYAAPMEGFTDRVWRQTHQKWFGTQGAADRYYAPFISPPENRVLIKKKMAELAPAANPGAPVIPQLLAKDGELAASGMLRDPVKLDAFLAAVFANAEGPISVKTRLGVEKPEEFATILDIYNRYPICELTIHPRVMRQLYRGQAAREELRGYLDDLYHGYSELFGSAGCAVSRMKGHWFYLIHKFEGAEKLEKQLRKAREPWEYEVVVNQIFTLPFRP